MERQKGNTMSNGVPNDFIYPVRLYTSSYMDITDYIIQGKANRKQPEPHIHEEKPLENPASSDRPVAHIRVTCKDPEEHGSVLNSLHSRLHNVPEMMYWLLAPRDAFFLFTKDMPRVFVPDPRGNGVQAGSDNDIYIAVMPWEDGSAA